jgi:hypothetical protein
MSDIITKSSPVEPNYIFKKPELQYLGLTVVKSLIATDTKDGSACESLQTLEIRIAALD